MESVRYKGVFIVRAKGGTWNFRIQGHSEYECFMYLSDAESKIDEMLKEDEMLKTRYERYEQWIRDNFG